MSERPHVAFTPESLAGGAAATAARRLASPARTSRRIRIDRWGARLVAGGGIAIIGSILAILFVIAAEVYPLFRPPAAERLGEPIGGAPEGQRPVGALGVDEYREIAHQVLSCGEIQLVDLVRGAALSPVAIPSLDGAAATRAVQTGGGDYAIGTSDGRVIPFAVRHRVAFEGGTRTVAAEPELGAPVVVDPEHRRPVVDLASAQGESGRILVAQLGPGDLAMVSSVGRRALVGDGLREESVRRLPVPAGVDLTALAMDRRGDELMAGTSGGQIVRYDLRDPAAPRRVETADAASRPGVAVTALEFLNGGRTLVAGDAAGGVSTWQVVAPATGGEPRLTRVHRFAPHAAPVVSIAASPRDRSFATADRSGEVRLHHATSGRTLLTLAHDAGPIRSIAFAPKSDALLATGDAGAITQWTLDNPHPEITWQTLVGKVWYEGYAEPAYVWQSSGGSDDFEGKFSLTPLVFGTLKGTLYALAVAVPMALLAALHVSEFMHPSFKAWVKPVVEVMAALPSVVLGFLAGLWLAPTIERIAPGLALLLPVQAAIILAALLLRRAVPATVRGRFRPGSEVVLLMPVVALGTWVAVRLGGALEAALLHGDHRVWLLSALGVAYDQRNSLVVGVAMGFAVIPVIFTIAEDALANVPAHLRAGSLALGATRWQTALFVVLPTASPGIFSAVMIGFGRAVGETMIVLMATGNTPVMDWSIFNGFRALSANIAVELPEAPEQGTLFRVLFLAAFLLFCLTFAVNTVAEVVRLKLRQRYREL